MKKRSLAWIILLAFVLSAVPLAAAGKAEPAKPAGPIKIMYWRSLTGVAGNAQEEVVKRFNASRSDVVVQAEFQGAYAEILQKLTAAVADFPQDRCGSFPMELVREFFLAFTNRARINLHLLCRHGGNSHHMAEALFKAFGRALGAAYAPRPGGRDGMSTKGDL